MSESHVKDHWRELSAAAIELRCAIAKLSDAIVAIPGDGPCNRKRATVALVKLCEGEQLLCNLLLHRMARKNARGWGLNAEDVPEPTSRNLLDLLAEAHNVKP